MTLEQDTKKCSLNNSAVLDSYFSDWSKLKLDLNVEKLH